MKEHEIGLLVIVTGRLIFLNFLQKRIDEHRKVW